MKKALLFTLAILTVLSMVFAMPATPVAAKSGEKSITLLFAQYIPNKGVTFKFKINGDFKDFTGFVVINGHEYNLSCNINDDGDLSCTASQGLQNYVGEIATITMNGYTFTAPIRDVAIRCYPIFDLAFRLPTWEQAGTYCQNVPANVGDEIYWYNPPYSTYYYYYYSLDGEDISTNPPDMGPGYYWDYGTSPT